jgi:hypothetical protein
MLKPYDAVPVQLKDHNKEAPFWILDKICGSEPKNCLCVIRRQDAQTVLLGARQPCIASNIERYSGTRSWNKRSSSSDLDQIPLGAVYAV